MAQLDKIRLSGTTYDIVDATAVHSLDGYWTTGETTAAITAATNALAESIAEQGYQTSGDVQNAISGKADTTAVTAINDTLTAHTANTDIHVTSADKESWNAKADIEDIPSVSGYADSVTFNSTSKYVEFYHGGTGGTKVFEYDASPFLIDGMVQDVKITRVTSAVTSDYTRYWPSQGASASSWSDMSSLAKFRIIPPNGCNNYHYNVQISDENGYVASGNVWSESDRTALATYADITTESEGAPSYSSWYVLTMKFGYKISYIDATYCYDDDGDTRTAGLPIKVGSDVVVTCLVISFNTDAGKQDINIPISDIFDASNYYTKAEVDAELSGKVATSAFTAYTAATNTALGNKADTTAVTEAISEAVSGKVDSSTYTAYTASTDTALSGKQETLVSGTNIKTINNESILGSGNLTIDTGNKVEVSGTTLVFL